MLADSSMGCFCNAAQRPPLDLNCDLGEGESPAQTEALLAGIDSANIACGGHAGDDASMRTCLRLAQTHGVRAGAHPGALDRQHVGRSTVHILPAQLPDLLLAQVSRLFRHASELRVPLRHIKLHGALYHATDQDEALAKAYLDFVTQSFPRLVVFARTHGAVAAEATRRGIEVWPEAFLDRGYRADGTLVPRSEPGALLSRPAEITQRISDLQDRGGWSSVDGHWLPLNPRTLCIHGDSPDAPALLRAAHDALNRSSQD